MQPFAKTFKPGTHLFHENDHSQELYIVQSGMIKIYRKIGTKDVELTKLAKGSVFGEMALIDGKPRSASALAIKETAVIVIDADTFLKKISGVPAWFMSMIRTTSEKIRKANSRLESIQTKNHCLHTIIALHYYFLRHGSATGTASFRELDLAHTTCELSQLLTVNNRCIMHLLDVLQTNGIIEVKEGRIILLDGTKLSGFCDYLRMVFKKAYEKIPGFSSEAIALIFSLGNFVALQKGGTEIKSEISNADMISACSQAKIERDHVRVLTEFKDSEILTYVKVQAAKPDAHPIEGYQFFITVPTYEKYLLYYAYKDLVETE